MLGSYAPFHEGHRDAIVSAEAALLESGYEIDSVVIVPHSDDYVQNKIQDTSWNIDRRILSIANATIVCRSTIFIDDISCRKPIGKDPTAAVIETLINNIGVESSNIIIAVGADNIMSMIPYIKSHKVACVQRPGYRRALSRLIENENFVDNKQNLIIAERRYNSADISSTIIRKKEFIYD